MALRPETLRAKIAHLRDGVARLRRLLGVGRERFLADRDLHWTVERGAQVAAECVLDIGNHVLAGALNGHAEEYRDIVPRLAGHGVLPAVLAERLDGLAGLRNLLVHDYATIDPGRLFDDLTAGLDAIEEYAATITAWMDREADS